MHPTHIVVDTRDGYLFGAGSDGIPFNLATATKFTKTRNSNQKPEYRTYEVFELNLVNTSDFYTITPDDVGKRTIKPFGRVRVVSDFMGRIFPDDVGKRVYNVRADDGTRTILQVENNAQRNKRLGVQT